MSASCGYRWACGGELLQRLGRPQQVRPLDRRLGRHAVLPHVVGDFMPAACPGPHGVGVELADAPRYEQGRLHGVSVEQVEQPPHADAAAELALRQLHRRLVEQAPQQHRIEVGGEVDGNPRAVRPARLRDHFVALGLRPHDVAHGVEIVELRGGFAVLAHGVLGVGDGREVCGEAVMDQLLDETAR